MFVETNAVVYEKAVAASVPVGGEIVFDLLEEDCFVVSIGR